MIKIVLNLWMQLDPHIYRHMHRPWDFSQPARMTPYTLTLSQLFYRADTHTFGLLLNLQ